jgi:signal transduction histidine kinase
VVQAAILSIAGWSALYDCRRGRLHRATYTTVTALILAATINLATVRNAEGAAVMTYSVAVGIAALVIEGREWLWWGGILALGALIGTLLHSFSVFPQAELPPVVAAAALVSAVTLGLGVPMGLFWLFSRDLTTSHERAWELAREAAVANRLTNERTRELEQRTEQLQAKNAELNDFLYVISHDLRAPLINLEGFSRVLQDSIGVLEEALPSPWPKRWPELRDDIGESLDFIVRSVGKMDFLVRGLIELSRIDRRPALTQTLALDGLVADVLDSFRYTIGERGIAVRIDPLPSVIGDAVRINQVFGNLIDNAVKYTKPAGAASIHIGCVRRNGTPQFFVRDNGVGIRAEDQGKIFRLFGRVGGHAVPGDGIGLTAVKRIVEKQGGRIWVESALGEGSTFWFTLPLAGAAEEREEEDGTATASGEDFAG